MQGPRGNANRKGRFAVISFLCWKWATKNYRSTFGPESVNTLARMIARNYDAPHVVKCVTNDAAGIDPSVEIVHDHEDFASVPSPHGGANPSCFRRLRLFGHDAAATFGQRIVSIDLDCVITGDIRPLVDRPEDFVAWADPMNLGQYNGSMMLLTAGSRPQAWDWFDPETSPAAAREAGYRGSDQAWLSYVLPGEAQWRRADGIYSYRADGLATKPLPADAKVVFLHGRHDPWSAQPQRLEWVQRHYQ